MAAIATDVPTSLFVWAFVLIGAVLVGFLVVSWLRKRLQQPDEPASPGFSLSDLRQMYQSGQLSQEEFERAKHKAVERLMQPPERRSKSDKNHDS